MSLEHTRGSINGNRRAFDEFKIEDDSSLNLQGWGNSNTISEIREANWAALREHKNVGLM